MQAEPPQLAIVVPCYNEEAALPETAARLLAVLERMRAAGKVAPVGGAWFVDDGSSDGTWATIERLVGEHPGRVSGIKLSRNRGHQNALMAGLFTADGDAVASIDADLQDNPDTIETMVEEYLRGADVVYGVRSGRTKDTLFKRTTAHGFYRLMRMLGVDLIYDHADFRLMSRRAVEALKDYPERNLFLRGIVPLVGFRSAIVRYERAERIAGESKYPIKKMVLFALDGITSFSVVPLTAITFLAFAVFVVAFGIGVWALGVRLFTDGTVPGWASTVIPMYVLGGLQILCIGVIGQYLGKVYVEVKGRPRYIIERVVGSHDSNADVGTRAAGDAGVGPHGVGRAPALGRAGVPLPGGVSAPR